MKSSLFEHFRSSEQGKSTIKSWKIFVNHYTFSHLSLLPQKRWKFWSCVRLPESSRLLKPKSNPLISKQSFRLTTCAQEWEIIQWSLLWPNTWLSMHKRSFFLWIFESADIILPQYLQSFFRSEESKTSQRARSFCHRFHSFLEK